ncbi:MAG: hypothetical protein IMW92_12270 [Bacillales bacterium]|nr:hypothetical protein [Bacillales bacterium]
MGRIVQVWSLEVELDGVQENIGNIRYDDLRCKRLGDELTDLSFVASNEIIDRLDNGDIEKIKLSTLETDDRVEEARYIHSFILESWTIRGNKVLALNPSRTVKYIKEPVER